MTGPLFQLCRGQKKPDTTFVVTKLGSQVTHGIHRGIYQPHKAQTFGLYRILLLDMTVRFNGKKINGALFSKRISRVLRTVFEQAQTNIVAKAPILIHRSIAMCFSMFQQCQNLVCFGRGATKETCQNIKYFNQTCKT